MSELFCCFIFRGLGALLKDVIAIARAGGGVCFELEVYIHSQCDVDVVVVETPSLHFTSNNGTPRSSNQAARHSTRATKSIHGRKDDDDDGPSPRGRLDASSGAYYTIKPKKKMAKKMATQARCRDGGVWCFEQRPSRGKGDDDGGRDGYSLG